MLKPGQTILLPKPGQETAHLWVVLTAPDAAGNVVMANFTTLRSHSDTTVVVNPGDHRFINHASVIHFADTRLTSASSVEAALASGIYPRHDDCTTILIDRILAGALASPYTPGKIKNYLHNR